MFNAKWKMFCIQNLYFKCRSKMLYLNVEKFQIKNYNVLAITILVKKWSCRDMKSFIFKKNRRIYQK